MKKKKMTPKQREEFLTMVRNHNNKVKQTTLVKDTNYLNL